MHHKAHIGLINSHSEGIGGNNQIASVINEIILIFASYFIAQSCVINQRIIAVFIEKIADFFYIFTGSTVNYSALIFVFAHNGE